LQDNSSPKACHRCKHKAYSITNICVAYFKLQTYWFRINMGRITVILLPKM